MAKTYNCTKIAKRVETWCISNHISQWADNKKNHLPFPYISIKKCVNTAEDIADVVVYNIVMGWLSGNAVSKYEEWELIYCLTFHCMPDFGLDKMGKSEQGAPNNLSLEKIWEVQK